jgi:hypothetical protein
MQSVAVSVSHFKNFFYVYQSVKHSRTILYNKFCEELLKLKLKLYYDRQSVCQSVLLSDTHLRPATNFSFSLKFSLYSCGFVILQRPVLLLLVSAVPFGSESHGSQDNILLSQFLRLSQPGGPGPRIYILQEQGGPDIPGALGSFSVTSQGSGGRSRLLPCDTTRTA